MDNPFSKLKLDPKAEPDVTRPIIEPPRVDVGDGAIPRPQEDEDAG